VSDATFVYCEKMDRKEFRVLIKHWFLAKKTTVKAKVWLEKHNSDSAPGKLTIEKWFSRFERGGMSIENAKNPQWTPERGCYRQEHKKVHKMILNNRKVKLMV
jgi:hypothetical protein